MDLSVVVIMISNKLTHSPSSLSLSLFLYISLFVSVYHSISIFSLHTYSKHTLTRFFTPFYYALSRMLSSIYSLSLSLTFSLSPSLSLSFSLFIPCLYQSICLSISHEYRLTQAATNESGNPCKLFYLAFWLNLSLSLSLPLHTHTHKHT